MATVAIADLALGVHGGQWGPPTANSPTECNHFMMMDYIDKTN
jgi:hypothetical protein